MSASPVLGTYRSVVVNNRDPQGGARVTLQIPQVLGDAVSNWAVPAVPTSIIPAPGDLLWVSFDGGDVNQPVYTPPGLLQLTESIEGLEGSTFTGSPPKAPSALALATSSVTSAEGVTTASVSANWTAPTENQDGTAPVKQLTGYRVQYSYDGVQWTGGAFTPDTTLMLDGITPGVLVTVRVQSLSNLSGPGLWASQSITASGVAAPIQGQHLAPTAIDGKTITGARFRTAATGRRIEIDSAVQNQVLAYPEATDNGDGGLTQPGGMTVFDDATNGSLTLSSPNMGQGKTELVLTSPRGNVLNGKKKAVLDAHEGNVGPYKWVANLTGGGIKDAEIGSGMTGVVRAWKRLEAQDGLDVVTGNLSLLGAASRLVFEGGSFLSTVTGGYLGLLTGASAAQVMKVGGLVVSNSYTDEVPGANGAYIKGMTTLDGLVTSNGIYNNTATFTANVGIATAPQGRLYRITSSERYKVGIKPETITDADILSLTPKSYVDKRQYEDDVKAGKDGATLPRYLGLIAEEVASTSLGPLLVPKDDRGRAESVAYDRVGVALIPVVQRLIRRVEELERKAAVTTAVPKSANPHE